VAARFVSIHADQVAKAVASGEATRSALVASWERSTKLHHLDPSSEARGNRLTRARLEEARQAVEPLLRVAAPTLDRLFLAVGGVGCSALIADRRGIPLDRRGAIADDRTFDSWGLWTGTEWSEEAEGTNGIGTCLVEQRALTIHLDQHFYARNSLLSCSTAPIFDERGELVAALDVSSCRADYTEGFVQLIAMAVGEAVRRIEFDNFRQAFPKARIVVAPTAETGGPTLLAIDLNDLVVGATRAARAAFGVTSAAIAKGLPAEDVLGEAADDRQGFFSAERVVVRRALARAGGNVSEAARTLGVSRATLHRKMSRHRQREG
jgi:transcriptional regulator of acetoin/glycerol metabolism